jgi:hypothetical protein|tara:strand:+ start:1074 stop:1550 length:477 start_codon:yes stop_codon:yes gene_type:complete
MEQDNKGGLTPREFFEYVSTPVTEDFTKFFYRAHNITLEKSDLYNEYLLSFFEIVFSTYLGPEHINTKQKMEEHFKWCWEKNNNNFAKEGIEIKNSKEIIDYFREFALESYYSVQKESNVETKIKWFWKKCFDYHGARTRSELDILGEVYTIFEKAIQ